METNINFIGDYPFGRLNKYNCVVDEYDKKIGYWEIADDSILIRIYKDYGDIEIIANYNETTQELIGKIRNFKYAWQNPGSAYLENDFKSRKME